jgi:hypothetical protein
VLYVAKSGRAYASDEDWFGLVGEHGAEAIDKICTRQPFEEIEFED